MDRTYPVMRPLSTLPDAYCITRVTYLTAPPRVANYSLQSRGAK